MVEHDKKADREAYGNDREKDSKKQKEEVGYYQGGFGRVREMFEDRTEDVSAPDHEDDTANDEKK